jgi:hypothetical protein
MWLPATSPIAVLWRERDADADVLGNADVAHYRAKAGRHTLCFFNTDIERATLARHRLERELPVGLPRQGTGREPSRSQLTLTLARRGAEKCRPLRPRLPTALAPAVGFRKRRRRAAIVPDQPPRKKIGRPSSGRPIPALHAGEAIRTCR